MREDKWRLLLVVAFVFQVSSLITFFIPGNIELFFSLFLIGGGLVIIYSLSLIFRSDAKKFPNGVDISITKKVLLTIIVGVLVISMLDGNWLLSVGIILIGVSVFFRRKE